MKKGIEPLGFVFALIFLALVLIFFYALFSISSQKAAEQTITSLNSISDKTNLLNYLRTQTEINEFTVSDLIVYSYHNKDFSNLDTITKDIFNKVHQKDKCPVWILNTKIKEDKFFEAQSDFTIDQLRGGGPRGRLLEIFGIKPLIFTNSEVGIPSFNQDKIKVTLITGCKK